MTTQIAGHVIVSYDVSDDRLRLRVCKTLEDFGDRVQYSVFECLLTAEQLRRLWERLQGVMAERADGDSVRVYSLCRSCASKVRWIGGKEPLEPQKVIII
jgi:CRISPR-associated protein Cas2